MAIMFGSGLEDCTLTDKTSHKRHYHFFSYGVTACYVGAVGTIGVVSNRSALAQEVDPALVCSPVI